MSCLLIVIHSLSDTTPTHHPHSQQTTINKHLHTSDRVTVEYLLDLPITAVIEDLVLYQAFHSYLVSIFSTEMLLCARSIVCYEKLWSSGDLGLSVSSKHSQPSPQRPPTRPTEGRLPTLSTLSTLRRALVTSVNYFTIFQSTKVHSYYPLHHSLTTLFLVHSPTQGCQLVLWNLRGISTHISSPLARLSK